MTRRFLPLILLLWTTGTFACRLLAGQARVPVLQFSDYHSHALPFYAEGGPDRGGIARAIHYLREARRHGAIVFSGGDMVNKGSPAWSDKYGCAEWSWLNGVVDDMALGNHDPDYGAEAFERCRKSIRYPILSANTAEFRRYDVVERAGERIGVFAVAGSDFKSLVKTGGFTFTDPIEAARNVVAELKKQRVSAIVMIGHEHLQDDMALARAVPGIDLIFGSHSHLRRELQQIPGTQTWFISAGQYLTDICRVVLTFEDHRLTNVSGELVPVDSRMKSDGALEERIEAMERALERDPKFAPLFQPIGKLSEPMTVEQLAHFAVTRMREATGADVALSTASSFRQPLPRGAITGELLRAALPYDNEIVTAEMRGDELAKLLAYGASLTGTDSFAIVDGVTSPDPSRSYRVATTDYLAHSSSYAKYFGNVTPSGKRVRALLFSPTR